ncbi:MAG: ABC transporter permease [Nitrososphaerota archaeon]
MKKILKLIIELLNFPQTVTLLLRYHEIIRLLTWRDFLARFRGSIFGVLWVFVQPLLMMIAYTLVFSYFLKVRFGSNDSPFVFSVYLLCGLVPWNSFNEGINLSCSLLRAHSNLVKKVIFPVEVLPVNLTLVTLIQQVIGLVLLFVFVLYVEGTIHWAVILIPLLLIFQFLFQTGLSWIVASLSVFVPDVRQAVSLLTLLLMFITPIMYPENLVPKKLNFLLILNPMAQIIGMYRRLLMEGRLPAIEQLIGVSVFSVLVWMVGYVWFNRTKHMFSDYL